MPTLIRAVATFCLALVLLTSGAVTAGEGTSLLRTTLIVADVDCAVAFYRLLGFRVEDEMGGERNPDSPFPLDSRSTRWRLVVLASATGEGGQA